MVVPHSRFCEAGTVRIDEDTCKQCGQCAAICPADVLAMENGHVCIGRTVRLGVSHVGIA